MLSPRSKDAILGVPLKTFASPPISSCYGSRAPEACLTDRGYFKTSVAFENLGESPLALNMVAALFSPAKLCFPDVEIEIEPPCSIPVNRGRLAG